MSLSIVFTVFAYGVMWAVLSGMGTFIVGVPFVLAWCKFIDWAGKKGLL